MNLQEIDVMQYELFVEKFKNVQFCHSSSWAKFREYIGWSNKLLGYYAEEELVAVTMILYKNVPHLKLKLAYTPGGYLISENCDEKNFVKELSSYLKKEKCFLYKIDPYQNFTKVDQKTLARENQKIKNYVSGYSSLGFKHLGYLDNFEGMQPRHTIIVNTNCDYEEAYARMNKRAKRMIKTSQKYSSLKIVDCDISDCESFHKLLCETSERDQFTIRDIDYFKQMFRDLNNLKMKFATVNKYLLMEELSNSCDKAKSEMEKLVKRHPAGGNQLTNLEARLSKLNAQLLELNDEKDDEILIAANLSIEYNNRCWYLYGASSSKYRFLGGAYGLMNEYLKECCNNNIEYYDLYGISGVFEPNHHSYGLYDFKRGFGGDIIELVGEFDYPLRPIIYKLYNEVYPRLKRAKKR